MRLPIDTETTHGYQTHRPMGHLLRVSCHAVRQLAARPWAPVDVLPERDAAGQDRQQPRTGHGRIGRAASELPNSPAGTAAPGSATPPATAAAQLVKFTTDVYSGEIDTRGGTLSKLSLVKEGDGKQRTFTSPSSITRRPTRISRARACSAATSRTTTTSSRRCRARRPCRATPKR